MNYDEFEKQHLRLVILRALCEQHNYTCNESILSQIAETFGFSKTRDHIKVQLRWLADIGAIELREVEGFLIGTIKRLGLDHVDGRIVIDDIKRPGPKA